MAAHGFTDYIALVRRAEGQLVSHGMSDIGKRVHVLTGIYYGSTWSLDFKVEKSTGRNLLFEQFLGRPFETLDDPRPAIGPTLFASLQASQDVHGVDMGHMLIGLDARMRDVPREQNFPGLQASGLELVTWAGDLGGGAARLSFDEGEGRGSVGRYFSGTDFGASSNLEGDIAAYLVGSDGATNLKAPVFAGTVADALAAYFLKPAVWDERKGRFLDIISGTPTLSPAMFGPKIKSFARLYYGTRVAKDHLTQPGQIYAGISHLHDASEQVARRFMTWLSVGTSHHPASKTRHHH